MDIKLYGSCNKITASIADSKSISIKLGKSGPILYVEATPVREKKDLEKLDKAKDLEKLDKAKDSEELDKAKDLESSDQAKDLKSPDQAKDLKSPDQAKDLKSPDQAKDLKSPDQAKDLKSLGEAKDLGKLNQVKDSGKLGKGKDLGKLDGAKVLKLSDTSKLSSSDQITEKSARSKENTRKKSKTRRDGLKKDTKAQEPLVKTPAKERSRISENKLAKNMASELPRTTSVAGSKKRPSLQTSETSIDNMNIAAMEIPVEEKKNVVFEYQVPILTALDSTQEELKAGRIPTAKYFDGRKPATATYQKVLVDPHRNCFPPLSFLKKEPRKKPFMFNSQMTFMDRHRNCFPDFIYYKTFSSSKSKTHVKTYTEYHKNCVPKYPGEQNGRKRKMSVSEEVLTPATVKKTLLERHKNCIPIIDFKDTYFKTEEQKRRLSNSTSSSHEKASLDRFINKYDTKFETVIPSPKLPRGDQTIHTLPKPDDKSTVAPKSAVPVADAEKTTNEGLDTITDDNNDEKDEETTIFSPNIPAGDENEHTLQETSQNIEQPLLT